MPNTYVDNKIKVSRNFAWFIFAICALSLPGEIFIEKLPFEAYWVSLAGCIISGLTIILIKSDFNKVPRIILVHGCALLACIFHAYKIGPGQAPLASLMAVQFAFISLPFALYNFYEKRMFIISMIINTSFLLFVPFINNWFDLPSDGRNYEMGLEAYSLYIIAGIIACTPLMMSANESYKHALELQIRNKENEALTRQNNQTLWVNTNFINITEIISLQIQSIEVLCSDILFKLCRELNCGNGSIVLHNKEKNLSEITAQFAGEIKKENSIQPGKSLVGEAFMKQEIIRIDNLPKNYINIHSGLGSASPSHACIVPITSFKESVGVLELASFKPFTDVEMELVDRVSKALAAAIVSLKGIIETTELVEQLQNQAQELYTKEEELRVNLEELNSTQTEMKRMHDLYEKRATEQNKSQQQLISKTIEKYNAAIIKHQENENSLEIVLREVQEELSALKNKTN